MSHVVSSSAPIASAHTVKQYAGFGILGADIPTTGDNGGSPAINDGISPASEYHWRVETAPSAGVLTIYPDLSAFWDGAGVADGSYPWVYRLFEDMVDVGTATVSQVVGAITLAISKSTHSHAADSISLIATDSASLSIADALHAHPVDGLLLTTQGLLSVAESLHGHATDNLTLDTSNTAFLVVQDAAHLHATDSVSLTLNTWLTISEAAHAHAAEAPSLSVQVALLATDSQHAHAADNVVLDASNAVFLVVQEAGNAHTADGVALTTQQLLSVSEALHGHVADQLQLDPGQHVLVIADARHLHFADQLFFSLEGVFRGLRIHVLTKRDRRFVLRKDPLIHVGAKNKRRVTTTH